MSAPLSKYWLARGIAAAILLIGAFQANAQSYNYTNLGTLGGNNSYAYGINNAGQIVGSAYKQFSGELGDFQAERATLWSGSTTTDLGTLGGPSSRAYAINNAGQIAGSAHDTAGDYQATRWYNGTISNLGTLGGQLSEAWGINSSGQAVGYAGIPSGSYRAAVWNGTTAADLGGGDFSVATAINDAGQIAGAMSLIYATTTATLWNGASTTFLDTLSGWTSSLAKGINNAGEVVGMVYSDPFVVSSLAVRWNGTHATALGTLGGSNSLANSINNAGLVVGFSYTVDEAQHATLWNGTAVADLNSFLDASVVSAGWVLQTARAINDNGAIVGDAYNIFTGQTHAFLLAPVPEPETWAMLLAGLAAMGAVVRRRTQNLPASI